MPKRLTTEKGLRRALADLEVANAAYNETQELGRTAARTNRLRSAKIQARARLHRLVFRGQLPESEARGIYEDCAPPDPEFGEAKWD